MLIDQAEHTPAPLKGTRLPIIFFIIKQLCKFFVKIYLQNDSTFMPNWKQKIFLSHFPCSAKLLSCIIITDIRSILYSKVSCSGGKIMNEEKALEEMSRLAGTQTEKICALLSQERHRPM